MFMKKIFKLLVFIILAVLTNTVFSSSWEISSPELNSAEDKIKTIKELKNEVKIIDEEKKVTDKNFNILKERIVIYNFFKENLTEVEKIELNKLTNEYKITKEKLNIQLQLRSKKLQNTEWTIKKLLENEKEIYKKLIPFIKTEKYQDYKSFIKKDLDIINKNSTLESNLVKKETIIKNKVADLKDKIEEHNQLLSDKLKNLVNNKIDEKLTELTSKEKFKELKQESKYKLFNKLVIDIEKKKNILQDKENKTRLLIKKIELYKIIIERIKKFKKEMK